MERRFKFRYVNELTGAMVLIVLALVIAAVLLTGRSQRWFSPRFTLHVLLPEKGSFGLSPGSEVFILGISAGSVEDISVEEAGRLRARVQIRKDFQQFVRTDSIASIKKVFGVVGDAYLEITKGKGEPLPEKGASITAVAAEELPGVVERLVGEVRQEILPVLRTAQLALEEWKKLGAGLQTTQSDLEKLVARMDRIAAGLERGQGTVGKLLTDSTVADAAESLLTQANKSVEELRTVLKSLQQGTERLPEITDAVATEAKDLPGLVLQAQQALSELEKLVTGLQRHWLVRGYMDLSGPSPRIPPGQVEGSRP